MKFSIAMVALVAGANAFVATPVERSPPTLAERDLATATSVLADVKAGFDALDKVAETFNGDPTQLNASATALLAKVQAGTKAIQAMQPLTVGECLALVGPANDLAAQGDELSRELKSRLNDVAAAKQCATVRGFLNKGVTDAAALISALAGKVPAVLKSTVQSQGDKVTKTLKDAQAAFAEDKCRDI